RHQRQLADQAWFARVEDFAFTDHRIEEPFEKASEARLGEHVPDQEAVIETDQPAGSAQAESAFEPPVRRVQRMREMRVVELEAMPGDLAHQRTAPIDANVAA